MPTYDLSKPKDVARFIQSTPKAMHKNWMVYFKKYYWKHDGKYDELLKIMESTND